MALSAESPASRVARSQIASQKLLSIQYLRAVAALMVVFRHAIHQFPGFIELLSNDAWLAGVDLFFVISGFVMVFVTDSREQSPFKFLSMRAARIVPVYWFYTLAAAFMIFVAPMLFKSNELSVRHVVLSLFFVPHSIAADPKDLSPLVKQGWTLNYEIFFYLLFAAAMAVSIRRRVVLTASILVTLTLLGLALRGMVPRPLNFYLNNIMLEFVFGMIIAEVFLSGKLRSIGRVGGVLLLVAGFAGMFALDPYADRARSLCYGLPASAVVIGALAFEPLANVARQRAFQFVGDVSYSIYLVHIFPIAVFRTVWRRAELGTTDFAHLLLFAGISLASAIVLGSVSYFLIEKTSLRYLRSVINGERPLLRGAAASDAG